MILGTFSKNPTEVQDFAVDWTAALAGDTIASFSATAPAGITKDSQSNTTTIGAVMLSGGTAGQSYEIAMSVTTAGGRTITGSILVKILALVVGTNAYASVASADSYHGARGNSAWFSADLDARTTALIRASAWIDATYRTRFPGMKKDGRNQPLEWPRLSALDVDGYSIGDTVIPVEVINATCEAALREAATPGSLAPDLERQARRLKAGSVEVEYEAGAREATRVQAVDLALSSLLKTTGGTASMLSGRVARG